MAAVEILSRFNPLIIEVCNQHVLFFFLQTNHKFHSNTWKMCEMKSASASNLNCLQLRLGLCFHSCAHLVFTTCLTQIYPQHRSQICLMLRDNWDSFTTEKAATTIGGKTEQDKWDFNSILIGLTATQYTIIASLQSGINDSESSDLSMCEQTTLHAKNAGQTYAVNTDISRAELDFTVRLASFFNVPTVTFWPGRKECFLVR